jgi:hypothetical protein
MSNGIVQIENRFIIYLNEDKLFDLKKEINVWFEMDSLKRIHFLNDIISLIIFWFGGVSIEH